MQKRQNNQDFDSFDFLDFFDKLSRIHTSCLKKGQWKTDQDDMELDNMAIIPFPVLCVNAAMYCKEQRRLKSNTKKTE